MTPPPPLLQLDEASVWRGGALVLDRLSLTIAQGEHVALLGPNGSGKSSLIGLLTRTLYPVLHGDGREPVRLFGESRWVVSALRSRLGIVTPDMDRDFIGAEVTGREAVVSGFFASVGLWRNHRVDSAMLAAADRALERLRVPHLAQRSVATLSTGELRRLLIARALVHEPAALLLDEPTTGLDLASRHEFLEALRHLARSGHSILLVTHHAEEIVPEINRIVALRDGRILHDGPPEQVLTAACLSELFGTRVEVRRRAGYYAVTLDHAAPTVAVT